MKRTRRAGERPDVCDGMHQTHVVPGKQIVHFCKIAFHPCRIILRKWIS